MSSIYQKRGILYYCYNYKDSKGKYRRISKSLKLKDTRRNWKIAKEIQKEKDRYYEALVKTNEENLQDEFRTLKDGFEAFIDTKINLKPKTIKFYHESFQQLKNYFDIERLVTSFTKEDFLKYEYYLRHKYESTYTAETYLNGAKIIFQFFFDNEWINRNPIKYKKTKPKVKHVASEEEINKAINGVKGNPEHKFLLELLYLTGMRISEAIKVRWEDIDWKEGVVKIRNEKAGREDLFPLYEDLRNLLEPKRKERGRLFDYVDTSSCRYLGKKIKQHADITFHDFRRAFGTRYAKKLKPSELKKLMHHEDSNTTEQYYVNLSITEIGEKL